MHVRVGPMTQRYLQKMFRVGDRKLFDFQAPADGAQIAASCPDPSEYAPRNAAALSRESTLAQARVRSLATALKRG
jgi:hypothetical protein